MCQNASHAGDNQEGTLVSWLHMYYGHLASVRFEHSVSRGSLVTNYIYNDNNNNDVAISKKHKVYIYIYKLI